MIDLGPGAVVLFGFSKTVLHGIADSVPAGSILVVEEPDVSHNRGIAELASRIPAVGELVEWPYQVPAELEGLLADPRLCRARAVVPGVEYAVRPAARAAEVLGLPGAGARAAAVFRDKYEQRELAQRSGIRCPPYALVDRPEQAAEFMRAIGDRCVLKPTARQASAGVQILDSPDELPAAWQASAEVDEGLIVPAREIPSRVLVEQAVTGAEYSVEVLVAGGRPCFANVTAKRLLPGRRPIEVGHVVPASGERGLLAVLVERTETLGKAAEFLSGVLHAEWIVDEDEPVLVECAARMPGDQIPTLISLAYRFPLVQAYLRCLLGEQPTCPDRAVGAAAIRFLIAEQGTVLGLRGVDEAHRLPGVHAVSLDAAPGRVIAEPHSSWDRAGHVIALADHPRAAECAALDAADRIRIDVRR